MEKLYNNNEAAEILGISPFSLRRKVRLKEIEYVKQGRRVLFSREALEDYIERCTVRRHE